MKEGRTPLLNTLGYIPEQFASILLTRCRLGVSFKYTNDLRLSFHYF